MKLSEVGGAPSIKLSQVSDTSDGASNSPAPWGNILQNAAQSVRTVMNPFQAMIPNQQMNDIATTPGISGDIGAAGGYALAHPILGGEIAQGGADAAKQLEGWFNSGGTQDINPSEIAGQAAIGGAKGVGMKFGVGGAINMVPGLRNFTANKLLDAAKGNRAQLGTDYGSALDNLETSANQSGRTANMGDYLTDLATTKTPPTSDAQGVANDVINEAQKRGLDLNNLSPKDSKEVQEIFNDKSDVWAKNTSNYNRATTGIGDMANQLRQIRDTAFPEFKGMSDEFQSGLEPFQKIGAPLANKSGDIIGTPRGVGKMMDKPPTGAEGDVMNSNVSPVFGKFGGQVFRDVSGFHKGVKLIGNILQRAAQMAGGVGAGYGIGKGIGGKVPPP